jgi:hypothetical protein
MWPLLILGGISTALSAFGQWKAGSAEKKAGEAAKRAAMSQAELTEYNAAVMHVQAQDALVRGEIDANRYRSKVRGIVGEQRAGFAAANVDVGFGSAVDVQADAAYLGELDALTAKTNAAREAWGFEVEATDLRKQAAITRKEGVNLAAAGAQRQSASRYQALGTIASGSYSLLEAKYGFGRRG